MNDSCIKATRGGFCPMKEKVIAVVNVENDDKNYRTMNEMRRNRSSIVAMQFGTKNKSSNLIPHKKLSFDIICFYQTFSL
jgi:hypothetical protein